MAAPDYDASPARAHEPLTATEVAALVAAGGRPVAKDPARVAHLLTRVDATLRAHARQVQDLHRDIDTIAATTRRKGAPMQVAVEALAALTDDQRAQVFDIATQTKMDELTQRLADADRVKTAVRNETNRVRFTLQRLATDPALPDDARAALAAALTALPVPPRPTDDPQPTAAADTPAAAPVTFVPPWATATAATTPAPTQRVETQPPAPYVEAQPPADPQPANPAPTPTPTVAFAVLEPTPDEPAWQVQAFIGGQCAGSVDITADAHAAYGLIVDHPYRRRGVATALVDETRRRFPDLHPTAPTTAEGQAFLDAYRTRTGWPA